MIQLTDCFSKSLLPSFRGRFFIDTDPPFGIDDPDIIIATVTVITILTLKIEKYSNGAEVIARIAISLSVGGTLHIISIISPAIG
jgi:hypothetical protein